MAYKDMFTVLIVDSRIERSQSLREAFARILRHLREDHHLRTDVIGSTGDAVIRLRSDASVACLLVEWGGTDGGIDGNRVLDTVADIGLEIPVFLVAPADDLAREQEGLLADVVRGLIYPEDDAPDFVARYVNRHFEAYIEQLKPPFFGRIIEFNESSSEMWTCPGHNGGMFYRRSPVGRVFYEYLGETVFRTDLDNSVVELGDLLVHEGPARKAEAAAAEIFGADRTWFVLNGTSTSNKVTTAALVARGDLVLFDRNNHKSNHHGALVLGGGIPVYLLGRPQPAWPDRAHRPGALDEDRIRSAIRDCPLVTDPDRWRAERPFRLAIIEQCSYDGTIYNVRAILDRIGHLCDEEPWEDVPTSVLLAEQQCWLLRPGARWHGFTQVTDGYAMTDPNKLTLVTPGFNRQTGEYLDWGVPAPMVAEFLRERGIVPEKNDLNTILFLVTPGIEISKAGTLITTLVDFKTFFDDNAPLRTVLPRVRGGQAAGLRQRAAA
jgi:ornithine decarboxylase